MIEWIIDAALHTGLLFSILSEMTPMQDYYGFSRTEIEPLLPPAAKRVLDVGCGRGATSGWLKNKYTKARFVGIEVNQELENELKSKLDEIYIVNLNHEKMPNIEGADLILLLDVLEHLLDPKSILESIVGNAGPDATFIISLPNIAHVSVSIPLLLCARFDYKDAGILDRTHLHFFTRKSAVALLNSVGLEAVRGLETGLEIRRYKLLDTLTLGLMRDRFTTQYIFAARRAPNGGRQGPIEWRPARSSSRS